MNCPYCEKEAIWVENKEIYGRNYGKSYMCYLCKDCDAYVGCHNNTKTPLGTLANKELREERRRTHEVLDPLWMSKRDRRKARTEVYKKIGSIIGEDVHVGGSNIERCLEIRNIIINNMV